MTLEQLRIFVCVAERLHMTAAAGELNMTQSAVSSAIAALEERHATKLFHRVGRGIGLSEAGQIFLGEARGVLARAKEAETVLRELRGLERGTLRIVASQTIAAYWLPPNLASFRQAYPGIEIDVAIGNTEQAADRLRDGAADLAIVEGEIDDPVLASWPMEEDRLKLVSADPFEDKRIDTKWLKRANWIMREQGSGTRSTLDRNLREMGIAPASLKVALVLPSNESVRTAVEAGAGVAVLSSLVVDPAISEGRLHSALIDFPIRRFFGMRHKERYRTKASDAFTDHLDEPRKSARTR
ncbi:LysR family transcriptional regulator [Altererythrobacter sp. FM1]|uniref:LysR family transcriptional regulator n=1 Tax=Tsuneonella flava TaxID=2055955 RepID=UPI000C805AE0|nr:LysR family transcriptional regulator [Tsuneonella flava]ROT95336.1 LysR family transcriptional regulator [Altererythrobacter sp. FM1]